MDSALTDDYAFSGSPHALSSNRAASFCAGVDVGTEGQPAAQPVAKTGLRFRRIRHVRVKPSMETANALLGGHKLRVRSLRLHPRH